MSHWWALDAHLELFVQLSPPSRPRGKHLIHIPVQVSFLNLCLSKQDGFHQRIVDKNILFLHWAGKLFRQSLDKDNGPCSSVHKDFSEISHPLTCKCSLGWRLKLMDMRGQRPQSEPENFSVCGCVLGSLWCWLCLHPLSASACCQWQCMCPSGQHQHCTEAK